jgi:hypothetical protein
MNVSAQSLGSIRVLHVGFGVSPKQAFVECDFAINCQRLSKIRDREVAVASTFATANPSGGGRDGCVPG